MKDNDIRCNETVGTLIVGTHVWYNGVEYVAFNKSLVRADCVLQLKSDTQVKRDARKNILLIVDEDAQNV
ncbi:MAG: hypothetical protein J6R32_11255 [Bacteroidales bacterium]|nr:hypothetical protein [Bacteroidales bacterium]